MIDTVVLTIPIIKGMITQGELFYPHLEVFKDHNVIKQKSYMKSVQNPSKRDVKEGNYKPRLTVFCRPVYPRGREFNLRIEFSAPKLLFGNNFDELEEADFQEVLRKLQTKLHEMGVSISLRRLSSAPVSAIHYSKNIVLDDYTSVSMITNQLKKVDVKTIIDTEQREYRNEGHLLRFHANSYELVFYDKIKDLQQAKISDKRAVEKDSIYQMCLFDELKSIKPFEVLRMEARLNKRQKIRSVFKNIGLSYHMDITFKEVFKKKIAQDVLLYFWEQMDKGIKFFSVDMSSIADIFSEIKRLRPSFSTNKILQLIGALLYIQESGVRQFRADLGLVGTKASVWYRLQNDLKVTNSMRTDSHYKRLLKIPEALKLFLPLKLASYSVK